jgi:hypothetical protein
MSTERSENIIRDYEFHTMLILRFAAGISHEESLLQLPFEHNCMNWILGHIVTNRSHVLEGVGAAHKWQQEVRALYHTGTPPVTPESPSVRFEVLVGYLEQSVELLKSALETVAEGYLDESHDNYRGEKSRYEHLTGFHWHEAFHVGQLEILRSFIQSRRESKPGQTI